MLPSRVWRLSLAGSPKLTGSVSSWTAERLGPPSRLGYPGSDLTMRWDRLPGHPQVFSTAFGILADGGEGFKHAVARELKRSKSFKFKTTLRRFELAVMMMITFARMTSGNRCRQGYAVPFSRCPCVGVTLIPLLGLW